MTNRKQKNLRLGEEYHEQLEKLAEEWFDSKKKQGQVVEKLIDLHGENEMIGMIQDIHSEVVGESSDSSSTHTNKDGNGQVVDELLDKSRNNESVDPEQYDLSVLKNKRGIDKAGVVVSVLNNELYSNDSISKGDVRELIMDEFNYSYNGANQLANSVAAKLDELPDIDSKISSISKTATDANSFFSSTNLETKDYCLPGEREGIITYNLMELRENASNRRGKTARRIADWLEEEK